MEQPLFNAIENPKKIISLVSLLNILSFSMSDAVIIAYEETDNTFPPTHFLVSTETIAKSG
jgi:hypothetical protein